MNRRTASGIMLTLLLIGLLTLRFNVQPVKSDWTWTETIYIRADGSIDPDTAPISTVGDITYALTDNVVGDVPKQSSAIVVERDNIVVDGASYTLQGTAIHYGNTGIDLSGKSNVTIKNMEIKWYYFGIWLDGSSNCNTISGNNITNNKDGIWLDGSPNNTISGNNITNNSFGIWLDSSANNTISGNNVENNADGIELMSSANNTISGNNITNNESGIALLGSSNYNIISGNSITENNWCGIELWSSSNNTISGNNIAENNWCGIALVGSSNCNTISGNNITNNESGIWLDSSSNNSIFHNNLIDNTLQVHMWS